LKKNVAAQSRQKMLTAFALRLLDLEGIAVKLFSASLRLLGN